MKSARVSLSDFAASMARRVPSNIGISNRRPLLADASAPGLFVVQVVRLHRQAHFLPASVQQRCVLCSTRFLRGLWVTNGRWKNENENGGCKFVTGFGADDIGAILRLLQQTA